MNSITEKEKKLSSMLERLKNFNFKNPKLDISIAEFNFFSFSFIEFIYIDIVLNRFFLV